MLPNRLIQSLVALGSVSSASLLPPKTVLLQSQQFSLFAAAANTVAIGPPNDPYLEWGTVVFITDGKKQKGSGCFQDISFPHGQPGGDFCSPVPPINGFPPAKCDNNAGLSWSITRYGKYYVQQFNYTRSPGLVYVACYRFSQDQFNCNGDTANYAPPEAQSPPYEQNFTARVGVKCPTH